MNQSQRVKETMAALRLVNIAVLNSVCVFWFNPLFFLRLLLFQAAPPTQERLQIDTRNKGGEYWFYLRRYSMLMNWISHCGD